MMGDGVIDIARIRGLAEAAGYRGFVEVELLLEALVGGRTRTRCCA